MKKPVLPPAKFMAYIEALACYCRDETYHGEYDLRYSFETEPHKDDRPEDQSDTCAVVSIDPVYLQMHITCYPALYLRWRDKRYKRVGNIILHEICHAYLKPLQRLWQWNDRKSDEQANQNVVETQTTRIQNTIARLLPENWFMPEVVAAATNRK